MRARRAWARVGRKQVSRECMQPLLILAMCLALAWAWSRLRTTRVRVITVIDGDTCMIVDGRGRKHKVRLKGVDAPERGQAHSEDAAQFLRDELLGRWSTARWYGKDKYRRRLAKLQGKSGDVSVGLLTRGLAYPMKDGGLHRFAYKARLLRRGVWGTGVRPHQSLKRRVRLLGWLAWKAETRSRKHKKR